VGARMEALMPQLEEEGVDVPTAIAAQAYRYLNMMKDEGRQ